MKELPNNNPALPPVEAFEDMLLASHQERETFYVAESHACDTINDLIGRDAPPSPDDLRRVEYSMALRDRLAYSELGPSGPALDAGNDYQYRLVSQLAEKGVNGQQIWEGTDSLSVHDVLHHYVDDLAQLGPYLRADETESPPDCASQRVDSILSLTETVGTSIRSLGVCLDAEASSELRERYEAAIADISTTLMDHDKVGLGIAFGRLNANPEWSQHFIPRVVDELNRIRTVESESSYRKVYGFVAQSLSGERLDEFLAQAPYEPTPPIFGSEVTMVTDTPNHYMIEQFEEGSLKWASLSDGTKAHLPFARYRMRSIAGYGTPQERALFDTQRIVEYDGLDEKAKAAIETAIRVDDGELLSIETMPNYKRVVLRHTDEGDKLYTASLRDGTDRSLSAYLPARSPADGERRLDNPVKHMEKVSDGYLVTRYNGGHVDEWTFRDPEPNFFGPEEFANAFWISGDARRVHSETDTKLQTYDAERDRTGDRFVIMPVRFLRVLEDREAGAAELAEEDAAQLEQIRARLLAEDAE